MFKKLKEKREKERQNRLIKMAEENGIYVPPVCRDYKQLHYGEGENRYTAMGLGGWYTSRKCRAEIAERGLKRRGLI